MRGSKACCTAASSVDIPYITVNNYVTIPRNECLHCHRQPGLDHRTAHCSHPTLSYCKTSYSTIFGHTNRSLVAGHDRVCKLARSDRTTTWNWNNTACPGRRARRPPGYINKWRRLDSINVIGSRSHEWTDASATYKADQQPAEICSIARHCRTQPTINELAHTSPALLRIPPI